MSKQISTQQLLDADIFLYRGTSWLAKAIRFFDGTEYNHASIFVGQNQVVEAIGSGVERQSVEQSTSDAVKVSVFRLMNRPNDVLPVLEVVPKYEGNRYGYEQLLLLALICSFRKIRMNNAVARFLRRILENAAGSLLHLTNGDRNALICSEFVYRCYDEALPDESDVYSIELAYGKSLFVSKLFERGFSTPDPQSLIAHFYGSHGLIANNSMSFPDRETLRSLSSEQPKGILNVDEMEKLLSDVEESYVNEDYELSKVEEESLKLELDKYLIASTSAKEFEASFRRSTAQVVSKFVRENANFVTPGDFLRATNLQKIGDLAK